MGSMEETKRKIMGAANDTRTIQEEERRGSQQEKDRLDSGNLKLRIEHDPENWKQRETMLQHTMKTKPLI